MDILNLITILLDHLDLSIEVAAQIKVFSFQVIGISMYFLFIVNNDSIYWSYIVLGYYYYILPYSSSA